MTYREPIQLVGGTGSPYTQKNGGVNALPTRALCYELGHTVRDL